MTVFERLRDWWLWRPAASEVTDDEMRVVYEWMTHQREPSTSVRDDEATLARHLIQLVGVLRTLRKLGAR